MMVTTLVTLILMVTCLTCTAGQLRHAALNTRDIDTVLADDTGQDVIMMEHSGDGEHCLLTVNGRLEDIEDQGCTLRESQICSRPRCVETTEAGVSVIEDRCEVSVTRAPVTDSLRVCSARGRIQCSGPCYKCPVACVKTLRTECRVGHVLRLETRVTRGDTWTEEEVVGKSLDCEERDEEQLCAPINCKHVNITHVCFDQEATSTEIQLRSRRCPICKDDTEECDDVITQECDSDPLARTWHKYCSANKQDLLQFTLNTTNAVAAQERPRSQDAVGFKQSIPIQHLNEIDTTGDKSDDDHDVKEMTRELLDLVKSEDELLAENMQVISNLQLHPSNINVNIKYNFVTQDETVQHKNATAAGELRTALERIESLKSVDASEDPLLRLIDNIVQTQDKLPSKDDIVHNKQVQINSTPVTPSAEEIAPGTSSRLPIIAVDKDLYDATATTTTERTQKEKDNAVALSKNLSPADFLRMCFLHGEGCEFGLGKGSSPEPSTTPAPLTTTTTTTATTTTTELPNNQMKLIQNRLRLCFFSNICDGSDSNIESDKVNSDNSQERRESLRQPRKIKTSEEVQHNNINSKPVSLSDKRRQTIKKLIQERARACLFHGVCN